MTEKELISWLSRGYWLKIKIEKLKQQRLELTALAEGVRGMDYSKSYSRGGEGSSLADSVLHLVALDQKINEKISEYAAAVDEITKAVNSVKDERLNTLLYLRYVKGERWGLIMNAMQYSRMQIQRLHKQALAEVRKKMLHNVTSVCDMI